MNGAAPLLSGLLLLFLLPLLPSLLLLEQTTGSRYHVGEVTPGYTSAYMNVYYCSTCDLFDAVSKLPLFHLSVGDNNCAVIHHFAQ